MNYYSQFGEDRWMWEHRQELELPERGTFIEVGAFDGRENSNTLAFEEQGWTGICIEPDPESAARCRENRRCLVFECAAGSAFGQRKFYCNRNGQLSRLQPPSPAEANHWIGVRQVEMRPLSWLLRWWQPRPLDLLSIDTEGSELEVWASAGVQRPKVVVMEHLSLPAPSKLLEIQDVMQKAGYTLKHYTEANAIFKHGV